MLAWWAGSPRAIRHTTGRIDDLEVCWLLPQLVLGEAARWLVFGPQTTVMQKADVGRIDVAFQDLQPVALELKGGRRRAVEHIGFQIGQWRRVCAWPHIGPDDPAALLAGIGHRLDPVLEVRLGWLVGHVEAVAGDVELPAVVHAP